MTSTLEDGGRVRVLTNKDGSILWEKMLSFDDADRQLSYLITDSKGFSSAYDVGYVGTVKVREKDPNTAIFLYRGDFEPTPGTTAEAARLRSMPSRVIAPRGSNASFIEKRSASGTLAASNDAAIEPNSSLFPVADEKVGIFVCKTGAF